MHSKSKWYNCSAHVKPIRVIYEALFTIWNKWMCNSRPGQQLSWIIDNRASIAPTTPNTSLKCAFCQRQNIDGNHQRAKKISWYQELRPYITCSLICFLFANEILQVRHMVHIYFAMGRGKMWISVLQLLPLVKGDEDHICGKWIVRKASIKSTIWMRTYVHAQQTFLESQRSILLKAITALLCLVCCTANMHYLHHSHFLHTCCSQLLLFHAFLPC